MTKIYANMKMNLTYEEVKNYIENTKEIKDSFVVIPSNIYIPYFIENKYNVGIQNISKYDNGAYTGEVSAKQAKSIGCNYTIIGHSERRNLFNETNEEVNKKIVKALENDLKVILCIGDNIEKKNNYLTKEVLKKQIESCLKDIKNIDNIILAYEPIWSIGTGLIPKIEELESITLYIKEVINNLYNKDITLLYGGSVNENNIKEIDFVRNINGYLVGGASLDPIRLNKMIEEVQ